MALVKRLVKGAPISAAEYDAVVGQVETNQQSIEVLNSQFNDSEVTLNFANLAAATSYWTTQDGLSNTPSDGVSIYIEDIKEFYKWDAADADKAVPTGRVFKEKANNGDLLENSTKEHTGGQIYTQVLAELFDSFPFANNNLVNTEILKQTRNAVKECYITDYNDSFDYLFSVFRRNQDVGGTYYYEARVTKVNKGTTTTVKIYRFRVSDTSPITSVDENGYQLLVSENNDAYFVVDWNEISEGTGYGQVLQDYLASENIGSLNYNKRIANYISNEKINIIDAKTTGIAVLTNVTSYIQNAALTSTGVVNSSISFRSIIDFPITAGKKVVGFGLENGSKYAAFKDVSDDVIHPVLTVENGKILTAPTGAVTLDYTIVGGADTPGDNPNFRFYIGDNDEDFELKAIGDYIITDEATKEKSISNEARIVALEGVLPDGGTFEDVFYTKTETDNKINIVDEKTNGASVLTDITSYIQNAALTSTGEVNASISFRSIIDFPISAGKKVAGFGMENGSKYAAFKDVSDDVIHPVLTVENGKILTAPVGSVTLDYTIVAGADTPGDNPNFRFYIGDNDEDFELKAIGDYKLTDEKTKEKSISNEARIIALESGLPDGGTFEDALNYGLLPSNTAVQNSQILNTALNGGNKTLTISKAGTYLFNGTVYIDDNTEIIVGKGVILKKAGYYTCMFLNRGALTRTTNYNIILRSFNLKVNGFDTLPDVTSPIFGLRGQISFFHIENLQVLDTRIDDIDITQWGIHVCSFKNLTIDTGYWKGDKDGIHLGRGDKFVITNHYIECYDDAVALNAHDYPNCNPEVGDITNGYIANIEDAKKDNTTGFCSRVLIGRWTDWSSGLQVQHGDTVVNNGNVYRVEKLSSGNTQHTTTVPPTHSSGVVVESTAEGDINWVFNRTGEHYTADVKDVKYENITTKDERKVCNVEIDEGSAFNRSVHPTVADEDYPIAEIIFDTLYAYQTTILTLITVQSKIKYQIDIYNVKKAFKKIFGAGSTDSSLTSYKSVVRIMNSDFRNIVGVTYEFGGSQTLAIVENNTHTTSVPVLMSAGARLITNNSVTNITNLDSPVTGDRIVENRVWKIWNGSTWVNVI